MTGLNDDIGLLDVLSYLSAKPWKVSLDEQTYEQILASDIDDVLDLHREMFVHNSLKLLFTIAWNDLRKDWNRHISFITDPGTRPHILRYLWLQKKLEIPGTTKFIFDGVKSPCFILTFLCGDEFDWQVELGRIPLIRITLPGKFRAFQTLSSFSIDVTNYLTLEGHDYINHQLLKVRDFAVPLDFETNERIDRLIKDFSKNLLHDLSDLSYTENICQMLRTLNYRFIDTKNLQNTLIDFHKTMAIMYVLLLNVGANDNELSYLFNSSNIHESEPIWLSQPLQDGGCLVLLGPKTTIDYVSFYVILTLLSAKLSSVQKTFHQHFETVHASSSAVAAIIARNKAHHHDSHIRPRTGLEEVLRRLRSLEAKGESS